MELHYTSYKARIGTRQPTEHYFYSPDFDFSIVLHKPLFCDRTFLQVNFGENSRIRTDYSGRVQKLNVPDGIVKLLLKKAEQFAKVCYNPGGLDAIVKGLMQIQEDAQDKSNPKEEQ